MRTRIVYLVCCLALVCAGIILPVRRAAAAPVNIVVGQRVALTAKVKIKKADLTTEVGVQEINSTGTVVAGPRLRGRTPWWNIDFDTGADGWAPASLLATANGLPSVSLTATPTSIASGGSATLTWSSTNASTCTASGSASFSGTKAISGTAVVQPAASTTYALSCTGPAGTGSATVQVAVSAGPVLPTVSLTAYPAAIVAGGSITLTWQAQNATGCTAGGGAYFTGSKAISGTVIVQPTATTSLTLTCTGPGGSRTASTSVTVSPAGGGGGTASAFANPDNGNIPDRARHPIAFPTALGFGRTASVRSRDAVVYKINSLDDVASPGDGKITYRECALALPVTTPYVIPAGRPRYCVFDVAGAIVMTGPAQITVPHIYIAGQTSPGGIEFRLGATYSPVDSLIDTRKGGNDMILRHVRTRTGEHPTRISENGDPIRMSGTSRQILDHVSTMFGTDESLDMACIDCTVQWSIIGPNICRNAGHTSALHCKSFFLKPAANVTIAHNLSQHGEQRGLNITVGVALSGPAQQSQADIVNNVLYDFIAESGLISNQYGDVYANYIGNVSLRGPFYNASDGNYLIGLYAASSARYPYGFKIYASGNVTPQTRIAGQFGSAVTDPFNAAAGLIANVSAMDVCGLNAAGDRDCTKVGTNVVQNTAFAVTPGTAGLSMDPSQISNAETAMRDVLAYAGADRCRDGNCRDNVDAGYIEDARTCDIAPFLFDTAWPQTVAQAGGWAKITPAAAKLDTDNDGMPDEWERKFRATNPLVWDANDDADGDGYPNIEEYLSSLAQDDVRYAGFLGSGTGRVPAYNCARPMYKACANNTCGQP